MFRTSTFSLLLVAVLLLSGWLLWVAPKDSLALDCEETVKAPQLHSVRDVLQGHFCEDFALIEPTLTGVDLSQMVDPSLLPPWECVKPDIVAAITLSEENIDSYRKKATAWDRNRQVTTAPENLPILN